MRLDRLMALRVRAHNIALEARNLSRIVDSEPFEKAWFAATEEQRLELEGYLANMDKMRVDGWIKRVLAGSDLALKPLKEIHEIAKAIGIPYYKTKSKEELIKEMKS